MMPFDQGTLEDVLIPAVNGSAVSLQRGVVTSPGKVLCPGDQEGNAVDGPIGAVGQLGYVLSVNGHRMWLPFDATVPWTIPNRQVTIGPDGDFNPVLELQRSRPSYLAGALMYLAGSSSTTELAWAIQDNGVTQATLRLTKNGLLLQDNVGSAGSRYFAYQADVTALQAATADTGWQTVTLLSGFAGSLAYRIVGPVVHWAGKVTRTAGAYPTTWTQIATIPSAAIPSRAGEYSISGRAPTGAMQCDIYSSGALRVSGTGTSTEAVFSGLTWL